MEVLPVFPSPRPVYVAFLILLLLTQSEAVLDRLDSESRVSDFTGNTVQIRRALFQSEKLFLRR